MREIIERFEEAADQRQEWKIKHKIGDIIGIVLFATIANADEWEEIGDFGKEYEELLREYFELPNGIPSHDTMRRVMGMIEPKFFQQLLLEWNEQLNSNEGEKLKKIINIDGKTMRQSGNSTKNALHVVTAWSSEDGISFGQIVVKEKANEIVAIPELLDQIRIKEQIITIDAMGTQTKIAEKIMKKGADYVLAVKGNQPTLYQDIIDYFEDKSLINGVIKSENYKKTVEKARGQIERREYFQTEDIDWLFMKKEWRGLKSIGMTRNTIERNGNVSVEERYFISSLGCDIELFAKAVRGHWAFESMHWHLDVTFREDFNATMDTTAALNLNIIRKFSLAILKVLDVGRKRCSMKRKRFIVCLNPVKYIRKIVSA